MYGYEPLHNSVLDVAFNIFALCGSTWQLVSVSQAASQLPYLINDDATAFFVVKD